MVDFHINGKRYSLSRNEVEDAVRDLQPDAIQSLAVSVNDRWWPAKQPFVRALGLRNTDVNSRTALRNLERLGFQVHDKATQGPIAGDEEVREALDDDRREIALSLAVDLTKGHSKQARDVIAVAQEFLKWLGGAQRPEATAGGEDQPSMDIKLYGLLVEKARHRETIAYRETGKGRAVIGPLLDEINRHEHLEGRPLLSVIVVHKGTTEPGEMFFALASDLNRHKVGDDRKAFVKQEQEAVFKTWAG